MPRCIGRFPISMESSFVQLLISTSDDSSCDVTFVSPEDAAMAFLLQGKVVKIFGRLSLEWL